MTDAAHKPPRRRWGRRVLISLLVVAGLLGVMVAVVAAVVATEAGTRWAVGQGLRLASQGEGVDVRVARVDGRLIDAVTLHGVEVADAEGPWLRAEQARLAWRPARLLRGHLWVDAVQAREVTILRAPAGETPPSREAEPLQALEFDLGPLERLTVQALEVDGLHLAEPVVGMAASFGLRGEVLGAAQDGVSASLEVRRLDAPGDASLAFTYQPNGVLGLHVAAFEPAGGAVARALALPGLPAVRLSLNGEGPPDAWSGALFAEAENLVQITGDLTAALTGPRPSVSLQGWVEPGGLMPVEVVTVTGQHLAFRVTAQQDSNGGLGVEALHLAGRGWTLDGTGRLDPQADSVAAHAVLDLTEGWVVEELAGVPLRSARAEVRLDGPVSAPRVTLDATAADTLVEAVDLRAEATLGADIPVRAEGRLRGLAPLVGEDGAWPADAPVDFSLAATVLEGAARLEVDSLTVTAPNLSAAYTGAVDLDPLVVDGRLQVTAVDLRGIGALAGLPELRGAGVVAADLRATEDAVAGTVQITLENLATGIAQADALLGGAVDVASSVRWAGEDLSLPDLRLRAPGILLDGAVSLRGLEHLDGAFVLGVPRLDRLDMGVSGIARLDATLGGTLTDPVISGTVSGREIMVGDLPVDDPRVSVRLTAAQVALNDLSARVAGVLVRGGLAVPFESGLLDGRLTATVEAGRPDALAALLGQPVVGDGLRAEVVLRPQDGRQSATATVAGQTVRLPEAGVTVQRVQADASLDDLFGQPTGRVTVALGSGAVAGVMAWQGGQGSLDLREGGGPFTLSLTGTQPVAVQARAAGVLDLTGPAVQVRLDALEALTQQGPTLRLLAPATLSVGETLALEGARLAVDGGTVALDARLGGGRIDLTAEAQGLSLDLLESAGLGAEYPVRGTVAASVRLSGRLSGPQGSLSLRTSPLALPEAGVEGLVVTADATLADGRLNAEARLSGITPQPGVLRADVPVVFSEAGVPSLPETQPLTLTADWAGPVQSLWALVPQVGHRLAGQAVVQARLTGTLAAPEASGEITLRQGVYENLDWGTTLRALTVTASLSGAGAVVIDGQATDGAAGRITLRGRIDPPVQGAEQQAEITLSLAQVQAVRRDDVQAGISGEVTYSGTLAAGLLRGDLRTETVRVTLGASAMGGGFAELDVVEVNRAAIGLPETEAQDPTATQAAPFGQDIHLDLLVQMPNRVYVAGQGLESEWQGEVQVGGTLADPRIVGALRVVRGAYSFIGRTFTVERGVVSFTGGEEIDPELDVRAVHEARGITALVTVGGTAREPRIELGSRPDLPQDEVISRVLFDRALGDLGAGEAIAVAQAAAQLAGVGPTGPGVLDRLRGAFALDVLAIGGGADGPTLEAGRYISDNIYVGLERGAEADSTAVEIEVDLTPSVTLSTRGGTRSGADIGIEWRYDY